MEQDTHIIQPRKELWQDRYGEKCVTRKISWQKASRLGERKERGERRDASSQKTDTVAHVMQQNPGRQMDCADYYLKTGGSDLLSHGDWWCGIPLCIDASVGQRRSWVIHPNVFSSSDMCLGCDIWRTGYWPCSTLSTSLMDPKEQRCNEQTNVEYSYDTIYANVADAHLFDNNNPWCHHNLSSSERSTDPYGVRKTHLATVNLMSGKHSTLRLETAMPGSVYARKLINMQIIS